MRNPSTPTPPDSLTTALVDRYSTAVLSSIKRGKEKATPALDLMDYFTLPGTTDPRHPTIAKIYRFRWALPRQLWRRNWGTWPCESEEFVLRSRRGGEEEIRRRELQQRKITKWYTGQLEGSSPPAPREEATRAVPRMPIALGAAVSAITFAAGTIVGAVIR